MSTQSAPVCILTAMPDEAAPFLELLEQPEALAAPLANVRATRGTLASHEVVLVTTGIGLVAAASAATWAIHTLRPSAVFSSGSCGGLAAATNVADIAVSDAVTYGTADATEFGYERGQVPGQPVRFAAAESVVARAREIAATDATWHVGRILSGDTFVTARNVADMRETFPDAVAADMESCAIGQVCAAMSVPFVSVRGISDLCGPAAGQDFHVGVDVAAARSRDAVLALLP
ncbi:5'-methylthioadenosine/adenosylhomocysteine nucleosidase [Gulosibacter bifidus]|uniref:adenosylhomocysteine nucleosidase n=1 Tax=Gulosibacter bifidus TaxID=272239 RepID=A0ABW5RIS9_9MICO|nr:5'-methylthioadenosine/adenosylhomocysteine nucleosidase [Gulosibacter bifidus]